MLMITRKFRVQVPYIKEAMNEIEQEFKRLKMTPYQTKPFRLELGGMDKSMNSMFYEFSEDEEKLEALIQYLKEDYKYIASIHY